MRPLLLFWLLARGAPAKNEDRCQTLSSVKAVDELFGGRVGVRVLALVPDESHPLKGNVYSDKHSSSNSRETKFETMFFEAEWCRKLFQMKVFLAAIDSVKFSSQSEISSRFFGLLKFSARFEYLFLK